MADIIIGNVRGPQGAQGAQGAQGEPGAAATVNVGTVTTTVYGNPAQVTNSGTTSAAVLDFVIPQGAPGSEVTDVSSLTLDSITETAASFPIPAIGEVMSVVLGKIVKFFGDTVAALASKLDIANVYNGLNKTDSGYALDARQGKVLNDKLGKIRRLNDTFIPSSWSSTTINNGSTVTIGTYTFTPGIYIVELRARVTGGGASADQVWNMAIRTQESVTSAAYGCTTYNAHSGRTGQITATHVLSVTANTTYYFMVSLNNADSAGEITNVGTVITQLA